VAGELTNLGKMNQHGVLFLRFLSGCPQNNEIMLYKEKCLFWDTLNLVEYLENTRQSTTIAIDLFKGYIF